MTDTTMTNAEAEAYWTAEEGRAQAGLEDILSSAFNEARAHPAVANWLSQYDGRDQHDVLACAIIRMINVEMDVPLAITPGNPGPIADAETNEDRPNTHDNGDGEQ